MGNVRSRKETGKLYFDFRYRNIRCREQTKLQNTPVNRKKLENIMDKIDAEILLGKFKYEDYFPNSAILEKIKYQDDLIRRNTDCIPTISEFFDVWIAELDFSWRKSYKKSVLSIFNNHILEVFGDRNVDTLTKSELLKFRADIAKKVRKNGTHVGAQHINKIMKFFKRIIIEASERYDFKSPFIGIKHLKTLKPQIEPFTLEEVMLILNNVRDDFKSYYTVRFFTGMRTSEIDGLKWKYVDFENRYISIRETLVKGRVEQTKTASSLRDIMMSQPVYEALKLQYQLTKKHDYVFCTRSGNPLDYGNVTKRIWQPILNYLGLKQRRAYQTRHTAATLWLASGENPEWVARQLGHSTTKMLFNVYSRYVPNVTRQDGSAFEKLLDKNM